MVAKGVDFYHYSDADDLRTDFHAPKIKHTLGPEANFRRNNLQISSKNIPGWNKYTGRLQWITRRGAKEITRQHHDISSYTGNLQNGTMGNMFNTPPLIGETTVCWGFYDAGSGKVSRMTNQHQVYVYVTRDQRGWMKRLADSDPRIANGPFHRFALPGAHDAGMFDRRTFMKVLNHPGLLAPLIAAFIAAGPKGKMVAAAGGIGRAFAPRAISHLSMTQKDNIKAMLDVGTRYFDYRPGWMHASVSIFTPGVLYHQHNLIPGYSYLDFLVDVLQWLHANPGEIVVVSANTQGFAANAMKPKTWDVQKVLDNALGRTMRPDGKQIGIGLRPDLEKSYAELIRTDTRLIFLNQIAEPHETSKYDSYNSGSATLSPGPIIAAFENMVPEMPIDEKRKVPHDYTVMQMQATSTNLPGIIAASIFSTSDAASPLLGTKAIMDIATNPWLRQHAAKNLPPDYLVVLLNDFVDNCMTETAIEVTKQRARA